MCKSRKKMSLRSTNKIGNNTVSINLRLILILNLKRDTEMWRQDFQNPSHPLPHNSSPLPFTVRRWPQSWETHLDTLTLLTCKREAVSIAPSICASDTLSACIPPHFTVYTSTSLFIKQPLSLIPRQAETEQTWFQLQKPISNLVWNTMHTMHVSILRQS